MCVRFVYVCVCILCMYVCAFCVCVCVFCMFMRAFACMCMFVCACTGTESRSVCVSVWEDLCRVIKSSSPSCDPRSGGHSPEVATPSCSLGLQHVHDSLDLLYKTYRSLRATGRGSAYSLIAPDYVPLIGLFLRQLCSGMVSKWAEDVAMETAKSSQGTYDALSVNVLK